MIKRTDANQKKIVELVRQLPGASITSTHTIGKGFPDLVIGYKGINYLIELKDGAKPKSQKKLRLRLKKLQITHPFPLTRYEPF